MTPNGVPEDFNEVSFLCDDVEVRWTLRKEFRYDSPRQRYLEREWQPVPIPERWPWNGQRGSEYAIGVEPEPDYDVDPMPRAEAIALAESLGGLPHMPNDLDEWEFVSTLADEYVPVTHLSIGWVGAYQDPNAPDYSEPDGGWYWMTGEPLEEWSNPAERPQNCDYNDPRPYPWYLCHPHEFGDGDRALLRPEAPPSPGTLMFSNWDDSGGTEEISYVIERPMFVMNEWRDYDGDSIYADWTVDLDGLDPNGLPHPALQHLRTYIPGTSHAENGAPTAQYYHTAHLGTTRVLTDSQGSASLGLFYNAWGGLEASVGTEDTRYGFIGLHGYQRDAETGFIHVGARYYDPTIGRFLQRDRVGIAGGLNVYAYAYNNPVMLFDPTGEFAFQFGVGGSATAGFWSFQGDISIVFDLSGNVGIAVTRGKGYGAGLSVGGHGLGGFYPDNTSIFDLAGTCVEVGVDTPWISTSMITGGMGPSGPGPYGGSQFSVGPGWGGGVRGTTNTTTVYGFNPLNWLYDWWIWG